ncbi:RNI-like superfamily protein [Wolffia australiana]
MDEILCDELLREIMRRLAPSSRPTAALVSKRWFNLLRSATSSLRLTFLPSPSLLGHYTSLSSLTLVLSQAPCPNSLLVSLSASPYLRQLSILSSAISPSTLSSISIFLPKLESLRFTSLRPLSFRWLLLFPSLRELAVHDCDEPGEFHEDDDEGDDCNLSLESLSLGRIRAGELGLGWLWRRCGKIQRLQLRGCEGTGDPTARFFSGAIANLRELELRTCRAIADTVLVLAATHCRSLAKLVLYDGGSRAGLRHLASHLRGQSLRTLDLRLPLDLDNDHLLAISDNFRYLSCLRLQSCCLVSGEGLRALGQSAIEELGLVNCHVVEREPGLLTTLGQSLKRLKKLDLSHNELLLDKELGAMLASCRNLVEIKLRGCKGLSDASMVALFRFCSLLETVDIERCHGISAQGAEFLILGAPRLRRVYVEEEKVSERVRDWVSRKMIRVF